MTSPAIVVSPEAGVAEIAELLSAKRISAVPVCDPNGRLLGIVSEWDLLRPFCESVRTRRDRWLAKAASGEDLSQSILNYLRRDSRSASSIMITQVVTATEQLTLPQLADLMMRHGVKRLPVLRNDIVVGVVSRADLVSALARVPTMLG
ncbi:CBS domain-containing protein [Acidisoma sp. L85]|uniref:CBS domain-containing protein n=1 Tax=Acidisoma sp. L85 TaxID=1641850 RepID=UPI00352A5E0A